MLEEIAKNALFSGAIGALVVMILTKFYDTWRDESRAKQERRLWIFRSLVQDRFHGLSDNFVAAINLVEIEFNGEKKVIGAWNKIRDAHHTANNEVIRRRTNELLIEIGKVLKFKNLNFTDPGYAPQFHIENYARIVLRDSLLIKLLENNKIIITKEPSVDKKSSDNLND